MYMLTNIKGAVTVHEFLGCKFLVQNDTQPSQACSGGQIIPNMIQIDAGDASLLMGSKN